MRAKVVLAIAVIALTACIPQPTPFVPPTTPAGAAPPVTVWIPATLPPRPTPALTSVVEGVEEFVPTTPTVIVPTLAPEEYPVVQGTPVNLEDPANWRRVGQYYQVGQIRVLALAHEERLHTPGFSCAWQLPAGFGHGDFTANVALGGNGVWLVRVLQDMTTTNVIERAQVRDSTCNANWEKVADGYAKAGILPDGVVVYDVQGERKLRRTDDPDFAFPLDADSFYVFCINTLCVLWERGGVKGWAFDFSGDPVRYQQFTWTPSVWRDVQAGCEGDVCWFSYSEGSVRVFLRGSSWKEVSK